MTGAVTTARTRQALRIGAWSTTTMMPETGAQAFSDGKRYALVVGIDTYSRGITPLKGAVADANAVIAELERTDRKDRYEKVFRCIDKDASRAGLLQRFAELSRILRNEENAWLFIYYAGHGISAARPEDAALKTPGYFIPHDAQLGDKRSYLSMKTVERALNRLTDNVRHLLLVLDCCFAGAFRWSGTQFRNLKNDSGALCWARYQRFLREPSWHVITSSAQDERALDTIDGKVMLAGDRGWTPEGFQKDKDRIGPSSPFAVALLRGLQGDADSQTGKDTKPDGVITGTELHFYISGTFDGWEQKQKNQRPLQKPMMFPWPTNENCKGEYVFSNPTAKLALLPTPVLDEEHIPYCGLSAYQEKNKDLFFGRDQAKKQLCERVKGQGLTVVVGASGTGKSSLVFAGLVPCLRMEKDPAWYILTPRQPGQSSLAALEAIATELGSPKADSLAAAVDAWCRAYQGAQLLMIIDQLEELITQSTTKDREEFLRLLGAVRDKRKDLHVVLTLRSDFEPHFRELLSSPDSPRFLIRYVSRAELHEMIERPADLCELSFESPQLVESLVDEVSDAPGALPLLSFTLREMVRLHIGDNIKQDQIDRTLRREDYEKLGGISGALSQRADKIYDKLDPKQQATLRRVLLRMVVLPERTRRRVLLSELVYDDPEENLRVEAVKKRLVDERLLVTGMDNQKQACVEPVHDKLVMGWQKLCTFIEEDKKDLPLARSLTQAVQEWEQVGRHSSKLWSGAWSGDPNLQLLQALQRKEPERFNKAENAFMVSSLKRQRNSRSIIVGTVLSIILGLFIGLLKVNQKNTEIKAQLLDGYVDQGRKALKQRNLTEALLWFHRAQREGWEGSSLPYLLHSAMQSVDATKAVLVGHSADVYAATFSPNSRLIVTASADKTARVWDAESGRLRATLAPHGESVVIATFSPNGRRIVTASQDFKARVWDAESGRLLTTIEVRDHGFTAVTFSPDPDGRRILTASDDNRARVWDAESGRLRATLAGHGDNINSATFSGDGHRIVTASADKTARVWDAESGQLVVELKGHKSVVNSAMFSPDGRLIVTASDDKTARIWDLNGRQLAPSKSHGDSVNSATFSPDRGDRRILTVSGYKTAWVWDFAGESPLAQLESHGTGVHSAVFSPDGRSIVTASNDKTALVWDAESGRLLATLAGHGSDINSATISPDGNSIVTTSSDMTARVWKTKGPWLLAELKGHKGTVNGATFSPDSRRIVTASDDKTARVWDIAGGPPLPMLEGHGDKVTRATFSPDGRRIVTLSYDKTARVWDAAGGLLWQISRAMSSSSREPRLAPMAATLPP